MTRFSTVTPAALTRVYWSLRLGIAIIWLWTAFVSWYVFPHGESLASLRRSGMTYQTEAVFAASCLLDLAMGIASCVLGRAWLWWTQCVLMLGYSLLIAVRMPEFLFHPFGPLSKNIAVLLCLWILALADRRADLSIWSTGRHRGHSNGSCRMSVGLPDQ